MLDNLEKCTSCGACKNICPKSAITFVANKEGFIRPKIDSGLCVNCGLCDRVCQINANPILYEHKHVYAAWINKSIRKNSGSGGIGYLLASKFIEAKGIVYGTAFNSKNYHPEIIRIDSVDKIESIRGSKYCLSDVKYSLKLIKKDLIDGLNVLFISTPCQIAGLKLFLKKEYLNLLTVDLICHGVCSYNYLEQEINYIKQKKNISKIDDVRFRGEGYNFSFTMWNEGVMLYKKKANLNYYFHGFLTGVTLQKNCLDCEYATTKRIGDITIGDFINYGKKVDVKCIDSPSIVLVNTNKGNKFFESVKMEIEYIREEPLSLASPECVSLYHPFKKHKLYDTFQENYSLTQNYSIAIRKTLKKSIIKNAILRYPKGILRRVKLLMGI